MDEDKILKKLRNHDKRFDAHDNRFDKIEAKLIDHDAKFDRVFDKLLEHDQRFDQLENRLEKRISESEDRILSAIDTVIKKNSDIEIEQTSTVAILDRHQDEINANKKDIIKIKKVVKMA